MDGVEIPNRPAFRAQEVCELVGLQPYVLRTWEAEFPDLGVAKSAQGPRLYRRADVERVLLIKQLLFVDGLTLAGARRRMSEQGLLATPGADGAPDEISLLDEDRRQQLSMLRRDLHWMLEVLSGTPAGRHEAPNAGGMPRGETIAAAGGPTRRTKSPRSTKSTSRRPSGSA